MEEEVSKTLARLGMRLEYSQCSVALTVKFADGE